IKMIMTKQISRRDFLQQSAAATVGFTIIPSFVTGKNISGGTARTCGSRTSPTRTNSALTDPFPC
ncbi:MAG: twin-arginine translocation signal domain-containing protein, partial [Tannerella sp.]|nr:twin-arginine translocation signal domain-containing protein [Tannerella sp.]